MLDRISHNVHNLRLRKRDLAPNAGSFKKCKQQDVFYERAQAVGIALHDGEKVLYLFGIVVPDVDKRVEISLDVRDGRAQFVRNICSKVGAQLFEPPQPRHIVKGDEDASELPIVSPNWLGCGEDAVRRATADDDLARYWTG